MACTQRLNLVSGARFFACPVASLLVVLVVLALPTISSARLIEAPREGAKANGPTEVVVNVGRGNVFARLNGERVERRFHHTAPKQRAVRVGAAEGLKPGRNVLRVRRETPRGESVRSRVVFRVEARGDIAGISARGEHIAGAPLSLRAHGSPERAWCLIHAPRRSALEPSGCASKRTRKATSTGIGDVDAQRTSFTPDVPGDYRVGLVSGAGPATTTDVYTVTAGPPTPLVSLNIPTGAVINTPITVGGKEYPPDSDPPNGLPMLQIVVVDRATLVQEWNNTYACSGFDQNCDADIATAVTSDLAPLTPDSLVFVSVLDLIGNEPLDPGVRENLKIGPATLGALKRIGLDPTVPFPDPPAGEGSVPSFAAVGIPTARPGEALVLRMNYGDGEGDPGETDLSGTLTRDQYNNYRPTPTDYLPLTVRTGATDATENTMTFGGTNQADALPASAEGGFQIVVVDGGTGEGQDHEGAVTNPGPSSSTVQSTLASVNQSIRPGDPDVLLVASLGDPAGAATEIPPDWTAFAEFVQKHGGTAHAVLSMKPGDDYAMAGQTGSGPADGIEVGPAAVTPPSTSQRESPGALTGMLVRNDDDWRLRPSAGETAVSNAEMMQTLYQAPTPWPEFDANAMTWIAGQVNLGNDVRQAYWTAPETHDWTQTKDDVKTLQCPSGDAGFSQGACTALQGQLVMEIGWLGSAQYYLGVPTGSLAAPFDAESELKAWSNVEAIAGEIQSSIGQPQGTINTSWLTILGDLTAIAGALDPEVGVVSALMLGASDLASMSQSGIAAGEDAFQTSVANFGGELQSRLEASQTSYERMLEIVAFDYGKLYKFGSMIGCEPGSAAPPIPPPGLPPLPPCTPGWQWDDEMRDAAGNSLQLWVQRQSWQELLKAKYGTGAFFGNYAPADLVASNAGDWHCRNPDTGRSFRPFGELPSSGQMNMFSTMAPDGPHHDIWTIASWDPYSADPGPKVPTDGLSDPLFAPYDANADPGAPGAGLGMVQAEFFWQLDPTPFSVLGANSYIAAYNCEF